MASTNPARNTIYNFLSQYCQSIYPLIALNKCFDDDFAAHVSCHKVSIAHNAFRLFNISGLLCCFSRFLFLLGSAASGQQY